MKKYLSVLLLLCLICIPAASCSKTAVSQNDSKIDGSVDVDLTVLSSTMVYAEVFNIITNPNNYIGKAIKMSGLYTASYYEETGQHYHFVIIEDATACCQQGLEFIWNGEHTYPDDYPEEQAKIELVGIYQSYEELGQTFYHLEVHDISILKSK